MKANIKYEHMKINELLMIFIGLIIQKQTRSDFELKTVIYGAYIKKGITLHQMQGCLMAFDIDTEKNVSRLIYTNNTILNIINNIYKENYITNIDYVILLATCFKGEIITYEQVIEEFKKMNIDSNLIDTASNDLFTQDKKTVKKQ